jgi:Domain of unknown function (DUF4383)
MAVRRFALVFGAVYVLVGLVGFALTGFGDFAASEGRTLILFDVNPLHNIVHLLVGGAWLAASRREDTARTVSVIIGAVYTAVAILGLFLVGNDGLNILALNQADNGLHLVSGLAGLYFGLAGRRAAAAV